MLDTILAPKSETDFFQQQKLQLLAVSDHKVQAGATLEDVIYNLMPGVAARSVILPLARHREWYARALRAVEDRIRSSGWRVMRVNRELCTIEYRYRTQKNWEVSDTAHVRLLFTDLTFMHVANEAREHQDDPPVDFAKVRAEVTEIIATDVELPESARTKLLTFAKNPSFPVSELSRQYARVKKDAALLRLAEAHAPRCARAAYGVIRELSYSDTRAGYPLLSWDDLAETEQRTWLSVTTKVICSETQPFVLGEAYGPTFLAVVQTTLMHIVGASGLYQRERDHLETLRARIEDPQSQS